MFANMQKQSQRLNVAQCFEQIIPYIEKLFRGAALSHHEYLLNVGEIYDCVTRVDYLESTEELCKLYNKIVDVISNILREQLVPRFQKLSDSTDMLRAYIELWEDYEKKLDIRNKVCHHLNVFYVRRCLDEGILFNKQDTEYPTIYDRGCLVWGELLEKYAGDSLVECVLNIFERQRKSEGEGGDDAAAAAVESDYLDKVVRNLITLSEKFNLIQDDEAMRVYKAEQRARAADDDQSKPPEYLKYYDELLEPKFLARTRQFYANETADHFERGESLRQFVLNLERRVEREMERVDRHLLPRTWPKVWSIMVQETIDKYLDTYEAELNPLMMDSNREDVDRLISLLKRVPNGEQTTLKMLEKCILKQGSSAIDTAEEIA